MTVDQKVLEEKVMKSEPLTAEETQAALKIAPIVEAVEEVMEGGFDEEPAKKEELSAPDKAEKSLDDEPPLEDDQIFKLERELAKPENQADLSTFTKREKSYFHTMQRDRKRAQKAEEDLDAALFREIQYKQKETEKAKVDAPAPVDPLDDLKKKDPTDLMTVADALKMFESVAKVKEQKKEEPKEAVEPQEDPVRMKYLTLCEAEGRALYPDDFDSVLELSNEILNTNQKYLVEVAKAIRKGENPAVKSYELIKADPEFANLFPAAQVRVKARQTAKKPDTENPPAPQKAVKTQDEIKKEEAARKAQDALERNKNKTKTTGNMQGGEDKPSDDLDWAEIAAMTDREFAKLPKPTRELYKKRMALL